MSLDGFVPWPEADAAAYRSAGVWAGETLDASVRRGARAFPERIAVVCGARRVSYAALDQTIDARAAGFLARGLRARDRVIVQLPNRLAFVETFFALLRMGAVPIMALPGHRRSELGYFCEHADARALVCADRVMGFDHRELARELLDVPGTTLRHVFVDGDAGSFVALDDVQAPPVELPALDPGDVALLQLSGGSTGTPKLIARTHDDYLYSVRTSVPLCGMTSDSVYLVALPAAHNFTMSSAGILGCLEAGGRVVMCPLPTPDVALPLMQREGVTTTALVPALARVWSMALQGMKLEIPAFEVLQVGGAKLGEALAKVLANTFPGRLQQVFGMAEGLVNYTRLDDASARVVSTQGRPMSPLDEVRVVDPRGVALPEGEVGELHTRGPYTIRGYFRAPEHDAHAFTRDGFYRTGDLVRRTREGDFIVEGRIKEQINRAGEKIATAELEAHLDAHPHVAESVVVGLRDAFVGERVCACIVTNAPLSTADVLAHLRARGIATYKMPDRVEFLPAIPKTHVGKPDRKAVRSDLQPPEAYA